MGGGSWILRDNNGVVDLQSRKAFDSSVLEEDFNLRVFVWAVESIKSHHFDKVIFASQDSELIGIALRPRVWPNFRFHFEVLSKVLCLFQEWRLELAVSDSNRGASLIVQSVPMKEEYNPMFLLVIICS